MNNRLEFITKQRQDFLVYLDELEERCEVEMTKTDEIVENNRTLREKV